MYGVYGVCVCGGGGDFCSRSDFSLVRDLLPRYVQIDSYWYYKGKSGGVTNWTATPTAFPGGLSALKDETGWPYVCP